MTRMAVCRQRCELTLLVMTHEAIRVSERLRLVFRLFGPMTVGAIHIGVLVVWERDAKLRDEARGLHAQTRKWMARRVVWYSLHVAIQANLRGRSLACEELLSMTIQARCMFRKIDDIRKRGVPFAHVFPVFGRKFVTGIAGEFLFVDVRTVRKFRVISSDGEHDKC